MAESSKKGRKRGSVPIEPIVFEQLTESFMEQIKKRESYLRAAGMWDFVTEGEAGTFRRRCLLGATGCCWSNNELNWGEKVNLWNIVLCVQP